MPGDGILQRFREAPPKFNQLYILQGQTMKKALYITLVLLCGNSSLVLAQINAVYEAGGQESQRQAQEREKELRKSIQQKPGNDEAINAEGAVADQSEETKPVEEIESIKEETDKVLINKIIVSGNTILPNSEIYAIVASFEGKELSMADMQKVADLVSDAFRQKGFITTRTILPPQQLDNNTLELKVVEGQMGNVDVQGNRFFKKRLFTKRISNQQGQPLDYNRLRADLSKLNQASDRSVKAVLTPGKEPGQTDVILNVKDRLPIHLGLTYDNYSSKYIGKHGFAGTLTHNNLLGFDDILTIEYRQAPSMNTYQLVSGRYLLPITSSTQLGLYAAHNDLELQKDFKALDAEGQSDVYSIFVNQELLTKDNYTIRGSLGFDYKDVFNYLLGEEDSRDKLRVVKLGVNVDGTDQFYGRNIVNNEISTGIPDFMGGSESIDDKSSRVGTGSKFIKNKTDVLRLQQLPWDANVLLKGQVQLSSHALPAVEQYQLGGINNVRGFAPGAAVGDSGETFTGEFSVPVYFLPQSIQVPYYKTKLYDAIRIPLYYDFGHVTLRNPQVGEKKETSLSSIGTGLSLNLPEDLTLRLDVAWKVNGETFDDKGQRVWMQASKQF